MGKFALVTDMHHAKEGTIALVAHIDAQGDYDGVLIPGDKDDSNIGGDYTGTYTGPWQNTDHILTITTVPAANIVSCLGNTAFTTAAGGVTYASALAHFGVENFLRNQTIAGVRFIALDAIYLSGAPDTHFSHDGNYDYPGSLPWTQLVWLDEQLALSIVPTIILVHQHAEPEDLHSSPWVREIINRASLRKILEKHACVKAVFQGHLHAERSHKCNGIHYITWLSMKEADADSPNKLLYYDVWIDPDAGTIISEGHGQHVDGTAATNRNWSFLPRTNTDFWIKGGT